MESRKVDVAHAKILNICKQLMEEENEIFFSVVVFDERSAS